MPLPPLHLVIEDDPVIARALSRAFELNGRTSLCITSCSDAQHLGDHYVSAVIDLHLPDGNGLELFVHLHERGMVKNAVFFSATTDPDEIRRAEELGVFIPKAHGVDCAVEAALHLEADDEPPESETRPSTPRMPVSKSTTADPPPVQIKSERK